MTTANWVKATREATAAALDGIDFQGYPLIAHAYRPASTAAPCAIVSPGSPYLTDGQTFNSWRVRHNVILVVEDQNNEIAGEQLDELIVVTVDALLDAEYNISNIGQPGQLETNTTLLAVSITVEKDINPFTL